MDIQVIELMVALGASGFLYGIGMLFMRNTHPYAGSRDEPFESKQRRRRIGLFFIGAGTLVVGIVVLTVILFFKNTG